ncbi:hypothetical protein Mext_0494 [Methylorubrum extorquens PA1]|nr:hypothetical protein Mext_0494 [Methylorubrum extorquens PA1]
MLRQTEVQTAQGKSIAVACKEADVSERGPSSAYGGGRFRSEGRRRGKEAPPLASTWSAGAWFY